MIRTDPAGVNHDLDPGPCPMCGRVDYFYVHWVQIGSDPYPSYTPGIVECANASCPSYLGVEVTLIGSAWRQTAPAPPEIVAWLHWCGSATAGDPQGADDLMCSGCRHAVSLEPERPGEVTLLIAHPGIRESAGDVHE